MIDTPANDDKPMTLREWIRSALMAVAAWTVVLALTALAAWAAADIIKAIA
jgi:hypothetical protein